MLGEEDIFLKNLRYSTTLTCHSSKGTLFCFPLESFLQLRNNETLWNEIMHQVAFKRFRQLADDIEPASQDMVK